MESGGQPCISTPGSDRAVCRVALAASAGGNVMVLVDDNAWACTAGARLKGWRYNAEVGSFPSWLEMLDSCLGRTAGVG